MKIVELNALLILLVSVFILSSCRTEDEELINPDAQEQLRANSVLADLIARVALKDGSWDNILDKASCFTLQLPVTVFIQSSEINVASEDDFNTIQEAINAAPDELATLDFQYPITILLADYTEVTLNNETELEEKVALCNTDTDEDIECVDFQYPLSYSVFNQNNEFLDVVTITTDAAHYAFVLSIVADDIISINFPFTLLFTDASSLGITSTVELQEAIENVIDTCDENDDIDEDEEEEEEEEEEENQIGVFIEDCSDLNILIFDANPGTTDFNLFFQDNGLLLAFSPTLGFAGTWELTQVGGEDGVVLALPDGVSLGLNTTWALDSITNGIIVLSNGSGSVLVLGCI
jgi:hypothetical protein